MELKYCVTRLPSNIRPATLEYVRLVTCGHLTKMAVSPFHPHSAIVKKPMLHSDFMALCFVEPKLLSKEVLHCGNMDFRPFMLMFLWPWARPDDLYVWTWPVFPGDITDVQIIWTSYVEAFKSFRVTDCRHDRNYIGLGYHAASRVVSNSSKFLKGSIEKIQNMLLLNNYLGHLVLRITYARGLGPYLSPKRLCDCFVGQFRPNSLQLEDD